jgi:Zn-dependent protease/CBS domain-containing protein
MGHGIRIARIFGIDIDLHPSWFIILILIVWSLATNVFPASYAWSTDTYWSVAVVAALMLFLSVLVHELAHSLIAQAQGIKVKSITLFLLGGVSSIEQDASSPGREALMAAAGPFTSLVIGAALWGLGVALHAHEVVSATLLYLGGLNILLAGFNLLPGFPLDGGRVLRAILWARWRDFDRATRGAARVGHVFGYLLIGAGFLLAAGYRDTFGGIWLAFIGWVLVQASQASGAQAKLRHDLAGLTVGDIMSAPAAMVPPNITLAAAADRYFVPFGARCLPVDGGNDEFDGLVCIGDLKRASPEQMEHDRIKDVMLPRSDVVTIEPERPATEAVQLMAKKQVNVLAVVKFGRLIGTVDRTAALRSIDRSG